MTPQPKPPRTRASDATPRPKGPRQDRPREFAKSAITRRRILEAAVACLVEVGYGRTSTNLVADRAGLARSAMQYHFPTRPELIRAVVEFIHHERNATYRDAMARLPKGVDKVDAAIDIYWRQVHGPLFIAYNEVHFAARTDEELAAILEPVTGAYEAERSAIHREIFPEYQTGGAAEADPGLSRELARFLVEGMALSELTYGARGHTVELLALLKQTLRGMRRART
jgi:AcrR family transcriptional regulator